MAKRAKTGGGSRKGIPNKITADLKEAIMQAFTELGGSAYLVKLGENPAAFRTLLGKLVPTSATATLRGGSLEEMVSMSMTVITGVPQSDNAG